MRLPPLGEAMCFGVALCVAALSCLRLLVPFDLAGVLEMMLIGVFGLLLLGAVYEAEKHGAAVRDLLDNW